MIRVWFQSLAVQTRYPQRFAPSSFFISNTNYDITIRDWISSKRNKEKLCAIAESHNRFRNVAMEAAPTMAFAGYEIETIGSG